jgi:hypothetical protein
MRDKNVRQVTMGGGALTGRRDEEKKVKMANVLCMNMEHSNLLKSP